MKVKKYILVTVLALVLIGIAYIRALLSHQDHPPHLSEEARASVPAEILEEYIRKDEVSARMDSIHRLYTDSLENIRLRWSNASDSADSASVDSLRKEIERLTQKLDRAESEAGRADKEKTIQFEKMVAAFYSGEIKRLPSDLSPYEHKVSVEEIRNKAMNYFEISSKTLSRIVKKYQ